jgi:hypothetical protein
MTVSHVYNSDLYALYAELQIERQRRHIAEDEACKLRREAVIFEKRLWEFETVLKRHRKELEYLHNLVNVRQAVAILGRWLTNLMVCASRRSR